MISIKYVNKQNGITHGSDFKDQDEYDAHQAKYPDMYDGEAYYIKDISAMRIAENVNAISRKYLSETDWYVIRKMEYGVEIPESVLAARALARSSVILIEPEADPVVEAPQEETAEPSESENA